MTMKEIIIVMDYLRGQVKKICSDIRENLMITALREQNYSPRISLAKFLRQKLSNFEVQ